MRNRLTFIVVAVAAAITSFLFMSADSASEHWTSAWISLSICTAAIAWFAWTFVRETSVRDMSWPIVLTALLLLTGISAGYFNQQRIEQQAKQWSNLMPMADESELTWQVRTAMLELYDAYHQSDGTVGFDELMESGIGTIDSTRISQFGVIHVTESAPDRIVYTAQTTRQIQFIGTLTTEGVRYERQN